MNVTFLIGNGFDMQLGLKTSYSDFLRWYVKRPSADIDIANFKLSLKSEAPSGPWWSDAELAMGAMFGKYTDQSIEKYYKCIRDFKQQLVVYLRSEQERCDYSNSTEIGENFASFLQTYQAEIMLSRDTEYFRPRQEDIAFSFINFNYTNTLLNLIDCCGGPGLIFGNHQDGGGIYSDIFGNALSIHGDLTSQIIMGVNDESQIKSTADSLSPKAQRTLIKPVTNQALNRPEDARAERMISDSDVIVLYGLSFGDTDRKWWITLQNWMLRSSSHRIVWFTRSDSGTLDPMMPEDLLDYVEDQRDVFLSKFKVSPDDKNYDRLKQQIFIIRNTQKLNFNIVKENKAAERTQEKELAGAHS